MNIKLLQKIKKHILEEPNRLYMPGWFIRGMPGERIEQDQVFPACGTACCIAGWACVLSDQDVNVLLAEILLGLTGAQANDLFHVSNWQEREAFYHASVRERAQIAAREIDKLCSI